ncbi:unnamed protein product [Spirodela intermedia]|uniref:Uncharacterized protein n=1 Tax=Spirodela intermedia TaxID=51605 RepID=A0A7I8JK64_SPIIN|nr:unnamed protein product [Spirodela intermedia]CAA6670509.1 unnamed protein product [Spirodela intermedia]
MDELRAPTTNASKPKPRRRKPSAQPKVDAKEQETPHSSLRMPRPSKRALKADLFSSFQETDGSAPDSLPDPSMSNDFVLDRELSEVDGTIKTLEDEKFALLDQLVILEGLIDPSDIQPKEAYDFLSEIVHEAAFM